MSPRNHFCSWNQWWFGNNQKGRSQWCDCTIRHSLEWRQVLAITFWSLPRNRPVALYLSTMVCLVQPFRSSSFDSNKVGTWYTVAADMEGNGEVDFCLIYEDLWRIWNIWPKLHMLPRLFGRLFVVSSFLRLTRGQWPYRRASVATSGLRLEISDPNYTFRWAYCFYGMSPFGSLWGHRNLPPLISEDLVPVSATLVWRKFVFVRALLMKNFH